MKRQNKCLSIPTFINKLLKFFSALSLFFFGVSSNLLALEVTLCENAIPPWIIEENNSISERSLIRIFTELVFNEIDGVKVKYKLLPWKRCQVEVENGSLDGALFMSSNEERRKMYVFSDPYIHYEDAFVYSKKNYPNGIKIEKLEDLKKFNVGVLRGHNYTSDIAQMMKDGTLKFTEVSNSEQNFKMVGAGRIDIMAEGALNSRYYIEQHNLGDKLGIIKNPFAPTYDMAYAFNKKSPINQHLAKINEVISQLRAKGIHTELLERNYFQPTQSSPVR